MIRKRSDMRRELARKMRGGEGEVEIIHLLEKDEFKQKGRLYAKNILKPGVSIGLHQHTGDFETYYILKGEGVVSDNGVQSEIKAGDLLITQNGESHSIKNTGNDDLEFIALVLYD